MRTVRNEKGIALVMVMAIALITLSIVASMLYIVTTGTKMSGYFKQFKSAEEASYGVSQMISEFMAVKGNLDLPLFKPDGTNWSIGGACRCDTNNDGNNPLTTPPGTTDDNIDVITGNRSCRCDKICNASAYWDLCGAADRSLDPTVNYDFRDLATGEPIILGTGQNQYAVFTKIVDTRGGNTEQGGIVTEGELGGAGVVASNSGIVNPMHAPYLYRIEVEARKTANPIERSRLSVLYAY